MIKMSKALKILIIVFIISLPFWLAMNYFQQGLQGFFYTKMIEKNPPKLLIAQIENKYPTIPQSLGLTAQSAFSLMVITGEQTNEKKLFEKSANQKMPIASISKLMTGAVASQFYSPSLDVAISQQAVNQPENFGELKPDETLKVKDLLHITLMESSNDGAFALSEIVGREDFVNLMNIKAQEIGMTNSQFFNSTGLDPDQTGDDYGNYSTSRDLAKLGKDILKDRLILEIIAKPYYALYSADGTFHHILKNTNELLGKITGAIGGKTGYTEKAGQCLLLIIKCPNKPNAHIINVILNSQDRFNDMRKLLDYVGAKYQCY